MQIHSPSTLRSRILDESEIAIVDVREQGAFSEGHPLHAVNIPLSRLDLVVRDLIPRLTTPVVLIDDPQQDAFAERAKVLLLEMGYTDVALLEGGIAAWSEAGQEVFSGVNVPSKAFGEFVEHTYDTPRLEAQRVKELLDRNENMVIVDSRPFPEFHRMSIPSGTDMPGAELVYRIHDLAPDPETLVVVNCAGRTRSIIGAQSLINAGIPNHVVALKDGTMGWHLAGFELAHGSERRADKPSKAGHDKAKQAATRVAERFGVSSADRQTVAEWLSDPGRTTYLLDVRSPEEFAAGTEAGYRNAPGGQLVQATDEYVAVRNARLVLADDDGVRATMTASWLIQMGWRDVFVLEGGLANLTSNTDHAGAPNPHSISVHDLEARLKELGIIDLSTSPEYERNHIPNAIWTVRARLAEAVAKCGNGKDIVLTCPDGQLAQHAVGEVSAMTESHVFALAGGTAAWSAASLPMESGLTHTVGALDDVWYKPYDHKGNQESFMQAYLTWEVALVEQIERDGTTKFRAF